MRTLLVALACSFASIGCGDADAGGPGGGGSGASASSASGSAPTTGSTGSTNASTSSGAGGAPPMMALEHLVGRFDESDPAGPVATWSSTSYQTRIDGGELSIDLGGASGVFFQVVIDGTPTEVIETDGSSPYVVASGLGSGEHDVLVYRRVEGFFGEVQFRGFIPGSGTTQVETVWPYAHRVEFIGDSITCGYGVEGPDAFCDFSGDTESAYETYAAIASRNVNAAAHLVAFSGKGVYQNYGGNLDDPMPELYARTLTDDPASAWDFSAFTPEAVVINLGTNDFSAPIDGNAFIGAYVDLLGTVRGHYPGAAIFTVTWQHWGGSNQGYVLTAVDQFGDANVFPVEFSIEPEDGWGCDYHPSKATHQKLGQKLTEVFQQTLGW